MEKKEKTVDPEVEGVEKALTECTKLEVGFDFHTIVVYRNYICLSYIGLPLLNFWREQLSLGLRNLANELR